MFKTDLFCKNVLTLSFLIYQYSFLGPHDRSFVMLYHQKKQQPKVSYVMLWHYQRKYNNKTHIYRNVLFHLWVQKAQCRMKEHLWEFRIQRMCLVFMCLGRHLDFVQHFPFSVLVLEQKVMIIIWFGGLKGRWHNSGVLFKLTKMCFLATVFFILPCQ